MKMFVLFMAFGLVGCGNLISEKAYVIDTRCDVDDCNIPTNAAAKSGGTTKAPSPKPTPTPAPSVTPDPVDPSFAIDGLSGPLTHENNKISWEKQEGFKAYDVYVDNRADCKTPSESHLGLTTQEQAISLSDLGYGPRYYVCVFGHSDKDDKLIAASNSPMEFKVSNVWVQRMAQTPPGRAGAAAVWADGKYVVWGGWDGAKEINDGHIYDPSTDTWRAMNTVGAPLPRYRHFAFWTGDYVLIYGGQKGNGQVQTGNFKYHLRTDTWEPISSVGAPNPQYAGPTVWTGETGDAATKNRLLVWSGMNCTSPSNCTSLASGGIYNFDTNTWEAMPTANAPSGRAFSNAQFIDGKFYITGGGTINGSPLGDRYVFDLKTKTWSSLPSFGYAARYAASDDVFEGVWAVWGGGYSRFFPDNQLYADGIRFNALTGAVNALPTENAPLPRTSPSRAVANGKLVIWGGQYITSLNVTLPVEGGSFYDFEKNTWTKMSDINAPPSTYGVWAQGVSTGEAYIYWSGNKGAGRSYSQDGGIFIP